MSFQLLSVPLDNNQCLYAFSLGLLLPSLNDDEKLDEAIDGLFGCISRRAYIIY